MEKEQSLKEKWEGPAMIVGMASSIIISISALIIIAHHIKKSK